MFFIKRPDISPIKRDFSKPYLSCPEVQSTYEREGWVVIRNAVTETEIAEAKETFQALSGMEGYAVGEKFESSGNFRSAGLQRTVFSYVHGFMSRIADRFANLDNCEIGDGGAFFIKPGSREKSKLEPHQDSPVIDERTTYAIFTWIPLQDINEENGALYVLSRSHLWGNSCRSQHIPWAFRNLNRQLWKYMKPQYINRGDILFFDPSLIHGSAGNYTSEIRVVLSGALLPKNHQKVEYLEKDGKLLQYDINDNYWLDGGRPEALVDYPYREVISSFPNPVKHSHLKTLVKALN